MPESVVPTTDVRLTEQQRRTIGAALEFTAMLEESLGQDPAGAITIRTLRLHVLGDLVFEELGL